MNSHVVPARRPAQRGSFGIADLIPHKRRGISMTDYWHGAPSDGRAAALQGAPARRS